MTQLDILKQDLQRLIDKWKGKKEVWTSKQHPQHLAYRCDRLKAMWIRKQLDRIEPSEEYIKKLF